MIIEQEQNRSGRPLEYVFGATQMQGERGRVRNLYVGWNLDGHPFATSDVRMLTTNAREMLRDNAPTPFPFDQNLARLTPSAFEFAEMAKPVDNPDSGRQFTKDIVSIACTDEFGKINFIEVNELLLMNAILKGQLEWNVGGIKSYSLMIPDEQIGKLNFILFSPEDAPSNEFGYRTFLLKVIKTLALIDRKQIPPDQKGYVRVLKAAMTYLEQRAAEAKVEPKGLAKIGLDLGILEETQREDQNQLAYLSVEQFRYVIQRYQDIVSQSFSRGKNV
jgi:hypothetical protein